LTLAASLLELEFSDGVHDFVEVIFAEAGAADHPVGVGGAAVALEVAEDVQVIGGARLQDIAPDHTRGWDETVVEGVVEIEG
jgi:hypothetical protein